MNASSQGQDLSSAIQGVAAALVVSGLVWRALDGWRQTAWLALPVLLFVLLLAFLWRVADGAAKSGPVFAAGLGVLVTFAASVAAAVSRVTGRLMPEVISMVLGVAALIGCILLYFSALRRITTAWHKIAVASAVVGVLTSLCLSAAVLAGHAAPGPGLPPRHANINGELRAEGSGPIIDEASQKTDPRHDNVLGDTSLTADGYCGMNVTARVVEHVGADLVDDAVAAITLHGATWAGCPIGNPLRAGTTLIWQLSYPGSVAPAGVLLVGPDCPAVVVEKDLASTLSLDNAAPCAEPWRSDGLHRAQSVATAGSCTTYLGAAAAASPYAAIPAPVAWLIAQAAQALDRSPYVVSHEGTVYEIGFQTRDGAATSIVTVEFDQSNQSAVATAGVSKGLSDRRTSCAPSDAVLGL